MKVEHNTESRRYLHPQLFRNAMFIWLGICTLDDGSVGAFGRSRPGGEYVFGNGARVQVLDQMTAIHASASARAIEALRAA